MIAEPNRQSLRRAFQLSENASDRKIAAAMRREARKFRRRGRAFVLPRDLDLEGCLAAFRVRLAAEQAFMDEIGDKLIADLDIIRRRFDQNERKAWLRIWTLQVVLDCAKKASPSAPDRNYD